MSIRCGTSRTFSRLEKLRRARVASTRAKSGDSFFVGKAGAAEGAQSATDQNSRLTSAPSRGGCRPPSWRLARPSRSPSRGPGYVAGRSSRDGYGYRPRESVARFPGAVRTFGASDPLGQDGDALLLHDSALLVDRAASRAGLPALRLERSPRAR